MIGGHAFGLYMGEVTEVRYGQGQTGGEAPQALIDGRFTTGGGFEGARLVGPLVPLVSTPDRPSWVVVGYLAGNVDDPVAWPLVTSDTRPSEWAYHDLWLEARRAAMHIHESGQLTFRGRAEGKSVAQSEDDGDADWRLRIDALGALFEMLGGGWRMARGTTAEGAAGDKLAIDAWTSPMFYAWVLAVTAGVNMAPGLAASVSAINAQIAAVQVQMAAILAWSAAPLPGGLALPGAGAVPPDPPAVPPELPAVVPIDPVPAYGDQAEQGGIGFQVAGELRTGSSKITGR